MVEQLRKSPEGNPEESREPAPMLEQELSLETLNAIKAIVSDDTEKVSSEESKTAIVEAISAHPDFEASIRPVEATQESAAITHTSDTLSAPQDHAATERDTPAPAEQTPAPLILTAAEKVATQQDQDQEEPEIEMGLIRQTVADSESEPKEQTYRAAEEEVITPPSVFLRLKRHLRNKLRMHLLIVKMKIRDRLPTKREALRAMTPRRIAIAIIIAAVLLEPWFLPTMFVLFGFFGSLILLAMGPDRCRHYGGLLWKRYKRKKPEKAQAISTRLMALLEKWQSKVDRLPSRWTQGLHLPQVQSEEDKYAAETAYAARMARIAQDETPKSYS